mmetsp:Transcript_51103/g.57068  ORF Transcript_51103/g.57068 Transcript_51103/m.57068 type:complete len:124 (+) Transcript_51103:772-1143(+)
MGGNSVTTKSTTPRPYKLKTFLYSKQPPIVDVHETTSPTSVAQKVTPSTTTKARTTFTHKPPAYTSTSTAVNDAVRQTDQDANVSTLGPYTTQSPALADANMIEVMMWKHTNWEKNFHVGDDD